MKKTLGILAVLMAISTTVHAKEAPRDAYLCVTAYTVTIELLESAGRPDLQVWPKEMKQLLLDKYVFEQTRLDITYQNFGTKYELMNNWMEDFCAYPSKI